MAASAPCPLEELVSLARNAATGELICATSDTEIHVYLQRGRVAWATTSRHPLEFVRHLRTQTRVDNDTMREVLDECRKKKKPLGETLVAWGVASWEDVRAALVHQIGLALSELRLVPSARSMFLERRHYTEYDESLTIELGELVPSGSLGTSASSNGAKRHDGFAKQLYEAIEGATWIDILDDRELVDSAPGGEPTSRVPMTLYDDSICDGAHFVALRAARGTVIGIRLSPRPTTLWCHLSADSTFGAAVSTLWSLLDAQQTTPPSWAPSGGGGPSSWSVGRGGCPAEEPIRSMVGKAQEVRAAIVLDPRGEVVTGVGRDAPAAEGVLGLVQRRSKILHSTHDVRPAARTSLEALGLTLRTVVTGEREGWCFGAELGLPRCHSVWMLADRTASQGFGWACLDALRRGVVHACENEVA